MLKTVIQAAMVMEDARPLERMPARLPKVRNGAERIILLHPQAPEEIFKLSRLDASGKTRRSRLRNQITAAWRAWSGIGAYGHIVREYRAYIDAMIAATMVGRLPPIAPPRRLVLTSFGLVHSVEKMRSRNGEIAPTLEDLVLSGRLDREALQALDSFAQDLFIFNIIATDLRWGNIVYDTFGPRPRFMLVDGYGTRTSISARRQFAFINRRKLNVSLTRLASRMGVAWDPRSRCFVREVSECKSDVQKRAWVPTFEPE